MRNLKNWVRWVVVLILGVIVGGCAVNRPSARETIEGTNIVREVRLNTWALWPATAEVAKQRASLGKTLSLGADGLKEDASGGTNLAESLKALGGLVERLR